PSRSRRRWGVGRNRWAIRFYRSWFRAWEPVPGPRGPEPAAPRTDRQPAGPARAWVLGLAQAAEALQTDHQPVEPVREQAVAPVAEPAAAILQMDLYPAR